MAIVVVVVVRYVARDINIFCPIHGELNRGKSNFKNCAWNMSRSKSYY